MTTTEQLTYIRSKCVEANGSILDLKFGCIVKASFPNRPFLSEVVLVNKNYAGNWLVAPLANVTTTIKEKNIVTVIGRPITLVDILIAIREKLQDGNKFNDALGDLLYFYWNLLEDLDHQSEETYSFLYELLCGK